MHSQLIKILQAMAPLLGDIYDGFSNDGVVWYGFMSQIVTNINGIVLIDTVGVILLSVVGLFLGGTLNSEINSFVRIVRGMMYCVSWIFEVLLSRKFSETYDLVL